MIDSDVILGDGVVIFNPDQVNIFGCEIGDNTFVGPFVEITRGVKIGKCCKVESHSFICDSVTLGNKVFIGHGVVFTNDLYPKVDRKVKYLKTIVEDYVSIGSNATIVAGITIGRHSIIGAGSVVTSSVPKCRLPAAIRQK
jgi:acetyltransferase-like isoleucine patch superfamily enzyme